MCCSYFFSCLWRKCVKTPKIPFLPANGMPNTHSLVKIHNGHCNDFFLLPKYNNLLLSDTASRQNKFEVHFYSLELLDTEWLFNQPNPTFKQPVVFFDHLPLCGYLHLLTPWFWVLLGESDILLLVWGACSCGHLISKALCYVKLSSEDYSFV